MKLITTLKRNKIISFFIFDYFYYKKEKIEKNLIWKNYLNSIDNVSIFLDKMLCLNYKFSIIVLSIKAFIVLENHLINFNQNVFNF